jgi:hypothetical protein
MCDRKFSITLPFDCEIVLALFSLKLVSKGFYVAPSFGLQAACASFTQNTCPHDGTSSCDCKLVTLLVYEKSGLSIPLVFHGHAGQTEIYTRFSTRQDELQLRIQKVLEEESDALLRLNE